MKLVLPQMVCTAILAAALCSGADGKGQPFPNWTDEEVLKIVADSPWAKEKSVRLIWQRKNEQNFTYKDVPGADPTAQKIGGPIGGIGVPRSSLPDRATIIVRWASALPIRHAKALYKQRDEKLDAGKLNELVGVAGPDYVLEIYGVPAEVAHKGTGSVEMVVQQSAYLRTRSGRTIRPTKVEASLHAATMTILVHFPRSQALTAADQEVECYADFQIFDVREKFKLNAMVYLNHLEL